MKLRAAFVGLLAVLLGVAVARVLAIGVTNEGRSGVCEVQIGNLLERVTGVGGVGDQTCAMPSDGAAYGVNENATRVIFTTHYRFINQKIAGDQRFTVGYRISVWNKNTQSWIQMAKNERAVDKTVSANGQLAGDCRAPELSLSGDTRFKITVLYDICGVNGTSKTRAITVSPTIPN